MKYFFLTISLILAVHFVDAQQILLEENVDYYDEEPEIGPNRKIFYHFYMSGGLSFGLSAQSKSPVSPWLSSYVDYGFRYKRKLSEFYSLGVESFLSNKNFRLADKDRRTFPDERHYDREMVHLLTYGLGFYNRFNFGKRGNYIGNFLDLGVYGDWIFLSRYYYEDEYNDNQSRRISQYSPHYLKSLKYGVLARVGFNNIVVFGQYRLSELIDPNTGYEDLPLLTVGFQIGFHK
ncbi:MAG: hypothetical protein R6T91_08965 [Bacteroidales bacterium]